jgi:hypothetical protein
MRMGVEYKWSSGRLSNGRVKCCVVSQKMMRVFEIVLSRSLFAA